ncbi:MAG: LysM peptidoglycan-binding domain-containing protein [Lachnospiraceae bacterium]|nr:LysM peptidoglycan-binding domain-containing protein [Lachnospiraceae bacterium]
MDTRTYEAMWNSEYKRRRNRIRRKRQFHRQCIMALLTVILVIILAVSYNAILSEANSDTGAVSYKYYTSIEVAYGESLWSIAEEYAGEEYVSVSDYIYEVMEINHLQEENIIAGQYLVVPYYSTVFK